MRPDLNTYKPVHICVSLENLSSKVPGPNFANVRRTMRLAALYIRQLEEKIQQLEQYQQSVREEDEQLVALAAPPKPPKAMTPNAYMPVAPTEQTEPPERVLPGFVKTGSAMQKTLESNTPGIVAVRKVRFL